jgi:hypothetical protein
MYPIAPGVVIRLAVTPSMPLDLVPTGPIGHGVGTDALAEFVADGAQVLREHERRAAAVGTYDDVDWKVRQLRARVRAGNERIVPAFDRAAEDS